MDDDPESDSASRAESGAQEAPTRLCPHCSALSETVGDFCPHCGASFLRRSRRLTRRASIIVATVLVLLLVGGGVTALAIKHNHDAAHKRAVAAALAARNAKLAAQNAAAAAKRAETAAQIASRHAAEREMQASITKWARKQVAEGTLDGPILRSTCDPVGGGSENLAEITVKYDCLAITNDNTDGTSEGYGVHATMDFNTGEYQWGLGNG
jgi:predicted nucleic acid-binding Zn ribbon protein